MTWIDATVEASTGFERVVGLRPNLYADYQRFAALLWAPWRIEAA